MIFQRLLVTLTLCHCEGSTPATPTRTAPLTSTPAELSLRVLAHPARGQTAEELAETCGKAEDAKCQYIAVEKCPEKVEYSKVCPEKCGKCPKATQPPTEKVTAAPSPSGPPSPPSPPPSWRCSARGCERVGVALGVSLRVSSRLCKTRCLLGLGKGNYGEVFQGTVLMAGGQCTTHYTTAPCAKMVPHIAI